MMQGRTKWALGFADSGRTVINFSIEGFVYVIGMGLGCQHSS